jgi:hypothetical protein
LTVLSVSVTDPVFDRKSAEAQYLARVLHQIATNLQANQGTVTSGTVLGTSSAGVTNTTVATYTYTSSATKP